MGTRTAHEGDCLCNMAVDAGFFNCQPLRDEPKNSAFLNRPLKEGDEVTIPDVRPRIENGSTDQVHKFVLRTAPPVSIRFVHGSPDKHYLEDVTVPSPNEGLNISTFVTNLGGKDEKQHFPDQYEFHEEGHVDPATFKVEVVDPAAGGFVDVRLEAMKPVYKANGVTVDHHETFDAAPDAALRRIDALKCKKVRSGVAYRSKYLRLVVDELDKKTVPEQTLLVTDTADGLGTDNDRVEILDQQVRASYVITRCPAPAPNQCRVSTQAAVGNDRKRVRLVVHIFKSPNIPLHEQEIRRRVKKWFRRAYAQANAAPKFVAPEVEFVGPPAGNMLVISQDTGNSPAGVNQNQNQSTLSFDLFSAAPGPQPNFVKDGSVSINLPPPVNPQSGQPQTQTPSDIGQLIKGALPQGYQADVFTNPTAFGSVQGSCDVLITKTGKLVDIRDNGQITDDLRLTARVARVDIDKVVISEGKGRANEELDLNGKLSSTPEIRRVIRAAPGTGDRLDIYVVGVLVPRDNPNIGRSDQTRGTTITPGADLAADLQATIPLRRRILLASYTMDSTDSEPFVLPHEAGHAMMDAFHVDVDIKDIDNPPPTHISQLMFGKVSAENAVKPSDRRLKTLTQVTKRLSDKRLSSKDSSEELMLVSQGMSDPAKPRSRSSVTLPTSEVKRLRERGKDVMEDW